MQTNANLNGKTIALGGVGSPRTVSALYLWGKSSNTSGITLTIGSSGSDILRTPVVHFEGSASMHIAAQLTTAGTASTGLLTIENHSTTGGGTLYLEGQVGTGSANGTIRFTGAAAETHLEGAAKIVNATTLIKEGGHTLVFDLTSSNASSLTGTLQFNEGRIVIGNATNDFNGLGTLVIQTTSSSGTREIALNDGTGASALTAARSFSNALDLSGGDLKFTRTREDDTSSFRRITFNPATATTTSLSTTAGAERQLSVGKLTEVVIGANQTFTGAAGVTLRKSGLGRLVLGGAVGTGGGTHTFDNYSTSDGGETYVIVAGTQTTGTASTGTAIGKGLHISATGAQTVISVRAGTGGANDTLVIGSGTNISLSVGARLKTEATPAGTSASPADARAAPRVKLESGANVDFGYNGATWGEIEFGGAVALGGVTFTGLATGGATRFAGDLTFNPTYDDYAASIGQNAGFNTELSGTAQTLFFNDESALGSDGGFGARGSGTVTLAGSLFKKSGTVDVDASITRLSVNGGLHISGSTFIGANNQVLTTVTLHAAAQLGGNVVFEGTGGRLALDGYSQSGVGVTVASGAFAEIALGGSVLHDAGAGVATTLALGAITFGDASAILRVSNYLGAYTAGGGGAAVSGDGTHLDVVSSTSALTSSQLLNQIWFFGYEKGATQTGGVLQPARGVIDSTFRPAANGGFRWVDNNSTAANWADEPFAGGTGTGDPYDIPNAPGAIARIIGANDGTGNQVIITGTITVGVLIAPNSNSFLGSGSTSSTPALLVFDSGEAGVPAVFVGGGNGSLSTASRTAASRFDVILRSDLDVVTGAPNSQWNQNISEEGGSYKITLKNYVTLTTQYGTEVYSLAYFDGRGDGSGNLTGNTTSYASADHGIKFGRSDASGAPNNTYSGGTYLEHNTGVGLAGTLEIAGFQSGNWLGTGPVVLNSDGWTDRTAVTTYVTGTRAFGYIYGEDWSAATRSFMRQIANEIVLSGHLATNSVWFNYTGNVDVENAAWNQGYGPIIWTGNPDGSARSGTSPTWLRNTGATDLVRGENSYPIDSFISHPKDETTLSSDFNTGNAVTTIFGPGFNFTGTGTLSFSGNGGRTMLAPDSTFSGGLWVFDGKLYIGGAAGAVHYAAAGANINPLTGSLTTDVTLGALAASKNYAGSGDIVLYAYSESDTHWGLMHVQTEGTIRLAGSTVVLGASQTGDTRVATLRLIGAGGIELAGGTVSPFYNPNRGGVLSLGSNTVLSGTIFNAVNPYTHAALSGTSTKKIGITLDTTGAVDATGATMPDATLSFSNTAGIYTSTTNPTNAGVLSVHRLVKSGAGTFTLDGSLTQIAVGAGGTALGDGIVTISGGALKLTENNQLRAPQLVLAGGALNLNGKKLDYAGTLTGNLTPAAPPPATRPSGTSPTPPPASASSNSRRTVRSTSAPAAAD
ncbi:MAG: hypothetical protein LBR07_04125 [Puniceicoccales bacterium]|nr:hypothetical protein [Puniceicoccales bacterium]